MNELLTNPVHVQNSPEVVRERAVASAVATVASQVQSHIHG